VLFHADPFLLEYKSIEMVTGLIPLLGKRRRYKKFKVTKFTKNHEVHKGTCRIAPGFSPGISV
jgi:hypothetical protein